MGWESEEGQSRHRGDKLEESVMRIGLAVEKDANRIRWREGVRAIAGGMRCIRPPSVKGKTPHWNSMMMDDEPLWRANTAPTLYLDSLFLMLPDHRYSFLPRCLSLNLKIKKLKTSLALNSSGGKMVRAPAFGAVDSGLILSRVKPMILNLVLTASTLKRTV